MPVPRGSFPGGGQRVVVTTIVFALFSRALGVSPGSVSGWAALQRFPIAVSPSSVAVFWLVSESLGPKLGPALGHGELDLLAAVLAAISPACCATETGLNIQRRVHTRPLRLTSGVPKLSWAIP